MKRLLLRLALGKWTYELILSSIRADPRMCDPHSIDIVVRKDAVERRIEGDWIKQVARLIRGMK